MFFEGTRGQPTSQRTASCIDGSTLVPTTGLDLAELDPTVQLYYQHGLADQLTRHTLKAFINPTSFARSTLYTIPSWSQKSCCVTSQ